MIGPEYIIPDDLAFDSFTELFSDTSPFSEDPFIQDWSSSSGSSSITEGQFSDNFNLDTLLMGGECSDLYSPADLNSDDIKVNDGNNNVIDIDEKGGTPLDDTFEAMINDTFKSFMNNQPCTTSKQKVCVEVGSNPIINHLMDPPQGPVASSSPRPIRLKPIQPVSQSNQLGQCTNPYVVPAVVPPYSDHQYHKYPTSRTAMEELFQHRLQTATKFQQLPPVSNPSPKMLLPGSYTWRGFDGLQRESISKVGKEISLILGQPSFRRLQKNAQRINPRVKPPKLKSQIVRKRPNKLVSVLKPIYRSSTLTKPLTNHGPKNAAVDSVMTKVNVIKRKKIVNLDPLLPNKTQEVSPSGWVTREDPVKEKKNQLERERRGELAMYRKKLKEMLPYTNETEKVATVNILEAAIDYCLEIQYELKNLEQSKLDERRRRGILMWRLASLKHQQKVHNNNVLSQISYNMQNV